MQKQPAPDEFNRHTTDHKRQLCKQYEVYKVYIIIIQTDIDYRLGKERDYQLNKTSDK